MSDNNFLKYIVFQIYQEKKLQPLIICHLTGTNFVDDTNVLYIMCKIGTN